MIAKPQTVPPGLHLHQSGAFAVELVTDPERFRSLKTEWDALWTRCGAKGIFQTFDCCLHMWEAIAQPEGRTLFCLVGWDHGRMVAVWPLTTQRRLAWKVLRPLEATGAEYVNILIDSTIDAQSWIASAFQFAVRRSRCDFALLAYVRVGTELNRALHLFLSSAKGTDAGPEAGEGTRCPLRGTLDTVPVLRGFLKNSTIEPDIGAYARLSEARDWESYYSSLSDRHRRNHESLRRRLANLGEVRFEIVEAGDPRCSGLIRWMLDQKKTWCERTNKKGHWVFSDHYRDFLTRLLSRPGTSSRAILLVLTLNSEPVAAKLGAITISLLELLIAGFDPRYAKYSPGMRLDEYWVRWAVEQKLDCDFGNGSERYKKFWSRDNIVETSRYLIPNSLWGRVFLQLRSWAKQVRQLKAKPMPVTKVGKFSCL